jgi:hypothetical protein
MKRICICSVIRGETTWTDSVTFDPDNKMVNIGQLSRLIPGVDKITHIDHIRDIQRTSVGAFSFEAIYYYFVVEITKDLENNRFQESYFLNIANLTTNEIVQLITCQGSGLKDILLSHLLRNQLCVSGDHWLQDAHGLANDLLPIEFTN